MTVRSPPTTRSDPPGEGALSPDEPPVQGDPSSFRDVRNFLGLAAYQVLVRIGWIFKTESIVMPAILDLLSNQAWIRGCLPLLNRFGQSIPPLLANDWVKTRPRKQRVLATTTAIMASAFLLLAWGWRWAHPASNPTALAAAWAPWAFLAIYAVFFCATGVNQLVLSSLQGKLVEPQRRGRLLWVSTVAGSAFAITAACLWMPAWLADTRRLPYVFAFTGGLFSLAALSTWMLREETDGFAASASSVGQIFHGAWRTVRDDANFRRLAIAATLFGCGFLLFPHYQALGRERMGMEFGDLLPLVVIQNAGTAACSLWIGPLADRRGNRAALRLLMVLIAAAPVLAVLMSHWGESAAIAYRYVFILVGVTPVAIRSFNNYALEIAGPEDHPRYLSALSLCFAAPIVASPVAGACIEIFGFAAVFLVIAGLLGAGWALCVGLHEPRHASRSSAPDVPSSD